MALTKGVGFINVQAFVERQGGSVAWQALLARLDPADRGVLASVAALGWYDLALYARLIREVDALFGKGDLMVVEQLGRFEAEQDIPRIQQWLLKIVRPSVAIEYIGKYWKRFHDTGQWVTEPKGTREVVARLAGWGVVDPALCREVVGYAHRSLELVGGLNVVVEHTRCRSHGAPECEFRGRWRSKEDIEFPPAGG